MYNACPPVPQDHRHAKSPVEKHMLYRLESTSTTPERLAD